MIIVACQHHHSKKFGKDRKGNQRHRCLDCGITWADQKSRPLGNMQIPLDKAVAALGMLLEGMSVRSTMRLTGLDRNTICDLVIVVGENCERFLKERVKGVAAREVAVDEIWSFVGLREKQRIARGYGESVGDSWTFFAIEKQTKLILAHTVGKRDNATCATFLRQLRDATAGRFELSSDGLLAYRLTVPFILGNRVDFGVIIKSYASQQEVTRYAPAKIVSVERRVEFGAPAYHRIGTSHVEVFNRQVRQSLKRFSRLTNAHSKSLRHHVAMQAIFVAWYNFCRKHEALKGKTPAMAAGLADGAWSIATMLQRAA